MCKEEREEGSACKHFTSQVSTCCCMLAGLIAITAPSLSCTEYLDIHQGQHITLLKHPC